MTAYIAIFRAALLTLLRYRAAALAGLFTQSFWGVLRVSLFLACYAGLPAHTATPLALEQVIDYVWLGQACFTLLPIRIDANVAAMMKDGTIAYELSRPIDLYAWWYVRSVALRLAPALLRGPPLVVLAALLPAPWGLHAPHDLTSAAYFVAGLLASLALSAALTALLSVVTILTLNGDGIARLFQLCSWLGSGMLLPLALFPDSVRWFVEALPFAGIIDTPLRLYVGSLSGSAALFALARQLAWAVALVMIGRKLLGHALRRVVVQEASVRHIVDTLEVAFALMRANFRAQLQYRVSFLLGSLGHLLITCGELLALWFLLLRFPRIGGWNFAELSVLYGIVNLSMTLGDALANGHDRLPLAIKQGTFDRLLLRPRSVTLQIIAQDFTLRRLGRGCQGLFALGYGLSHTQALLLESPAKVALMLFCIVSGALVFLGLWIIQGAFCFFSVESLEAMNVLTYGGSELAQYPFPIYARWLRILFTSLAPLSLTTYFPTLALLDKLDPLGTSRAFQWSAPLFGPLFLSATFLVWRFGVKHYTSTGS